jgi:hypothetical protein
MGTLLTDKEEILRPLNERTDRLAVRVAIVGASDKGDIL